MGILLWSKTVRRFALLKQEGIFMFSWLKSSFVKALIKIGLKAYTEKNDNEITNSIVEEIEKELDE